MTNLLTRTCTRWLFSSISFTKVVKWTWRRESSAWTTKSKFWWRAALKPLNLQLKTICSPPQLSKSIKTVILWVFLITKFWAPRDVCKTRTSRWSHFKKRLRLYSSRQLRVLWWIKIRSRSALALKCRSSGLSRCRMTILFVRFSTDPMRGSTSHLWMVSKFKTNIWMETTWGRTHSTPLRLRKSSTGTLTGAPVQEVSNWLIRMARYSWVSATKAVTDLSKI